MERAFLRSAAPLIGLLFVGLGGCSSRVVSGAQNSAEHHAELDAEQQQLEMIPPPSKNRYMSVHSYESWANPFITVQANMLTLHVLLADANPVEYGAGGMLRPVNARREDVTISPEKLGEAMEAIPESSWPYGRVVAVEEAHKTPRDQEPAVRRNMEATVSALNMLGIVAYDMVDGTVR